jgi:hypothetical protein
MKRESPRHAVTQQLQQPLAPSFYDDQISVYALLNPPLFTFMPVNYGIRFFGNGHVLRSFRLVLASAFRLYLSYQALLATMRSFVISR